MRVNETTDPALASSVMEAGPLILQAFAWDMAPDASHWRYLAAHAQEIADLGVTAIWLPPAYKGHEGINDVGYGVYDLYDLGEFDQRGSVPTKYGTKDEYLGGRHQCPARGGYRGVRRHRPQPSHGCRRNRDRARHPDQPPEPA